MKALIYLDRNRAALAVVIGLLIACAASYWGLVLSGAVPRPATIPNSGENDSSMAAAASVLAVTAAAFLTSMTGSRRRAAGVWLGGLAVAALVVAVAR